MPHKNPRQQHHDMLFPPQSHNPKTPPHASVRLYVMRLTGPLTTQTKRNHKEQKMKRPQPLLTLNRKRGEKEKAQRTFKYKSAPLRVGVSSGTHPGVIGTGVPYSSCSSLVQPAFPPFLGPFPFPSLLLFAFARVRAATLSAPRLFARSEPWLEVSPAATATFTVTEWG